MQQHHLLLHEMRGSRLQPARQRRVHEPEFSARQMQQVCRYGEGASVDLCSKCKRRQSCHFAIRLREQNAGKCDAHFNRHESKGHRRQGIDSSPTATSKLLGAQEPRGPSHAGPRIRGLEGRAEAVNKVHPHHL